MKSRRHDKILELISECNIDTQEELQERLNQDFVLLRQRYPAILKSFV